jgi:phosphate transport system protein
MSQLSESYLGRIRETLLLMSSLVERNLALALRALVERGDELADSVELEDSPIDQLEVAIDEMVVTYMATRAPVATDCRFMLVASKISSDLERIGDQATTIARRAKELNLEPPLKPWIDIPLMAETVQDMLRDSITAYVDVNPDLAQEVIRRDTAVDARNRQLHRALTAYMIENPNAITRCLHLMTVGKALERAGDHVQNIAEEVYYLYSGRDIRHERSIAAA